MVCSLGSENQFETWISVKNQPVGHVMSQEITPNPEATDLINQHRLHCLQQVPPPLQTRTRHPLVFLASEPVSPADPALVLSIMAFFFALSQDHAQLPML